MKTLHLAATAVLFVGSDAALAHPVHEVVQNAYLTLAPGRVDLELELTAGPQVAGKIISALDANRDRRISLIEANAFASRVLTTSRLSVDGKMKDLRLVSVDVPSYPALLGAHGAIKITATAARSNTIGRATLSYRNGFAPAESRCDTNIFLKSGDGLEYVVTNQVRGRDGRDLIIRFTTVSGQ